MSARDIYDFYTSKVSPKSCLRMVCFLCHPRLTGHPGCYGAPWFLSLQELWGLLSTREAARLLRLNLQPERMGGGWLRLCSACFLFFFFFFFASWSAVTMLSRPLGSACRENPNIAENMKYLWTSSVAHLDLGDGGKFGTSSSQRPCLYLLCLVPYVQSWAPLSRSCPEAGQGWLPPPA